MIIAKVCGPTIVVSLGLGGAIAGAVTCAMPGKDASINTVKQVTMAEEILINLAH